MAKKKKSGFFVRLGIILLTIVLLLGGTYLLLDKAIVPKYFGAYNINNLGDLVGMVTTLYNNPKESEIVKNGYTLSDKSNVEQKLKDAGFPKYEDGSLDYDKIASGDFIIDPTKQLEITDRELAATMNEMVAHGVLSSKVPSLRFINEMSLTILEMNITPKKVDDVVDSRSAYVSITLKFDTETIIEQISKEMDTPVFLLNMIIPKTMYISLGYDLTIDSEGVCHEENGSMAVNGRTVKQSKILLDMLVQFIFPQEDEMTAEKLVDTIGSSLIRGINMLGNIEFKENIKEKQNGVVLTFPEQ